MDRWPFDMTTMRHCRPVGRRCAASLILAGLGAALTRPSLAATPLAPPKDFKFRVLRDKSEIGTHTIAFEDSGSALTVRTHIRLTVKVAFITAFRYEHDGEEKWEDGRIVALRTRTHDNGPDYTVTGAREANGFRVIGPEGPYVAPPDLLPSSAVWHPDYVRQTSIINVEQGGTMGLSTRKLDSESVPALGGTVTAQKYRMVTPHCGGFVWYDPSSRWIRAMVEIKGEKLTYEPV